MNSAKLNTLQSPNNDKVYHVQLNTKIHINILLQSFSFIKVLSSKIQSYGTVITDSANQSKSYGLNYVNHMLRYSL